MLLMTTVLPAVVSSLIVFKFPQFMNADGPIASSVELLMLAVCRYAFSKKHFYGIDETYDMPID